MDVFVFWSAYGGGGVGCSDCANHRCDMDGVCVQTNQQIGVISGMAICDMDAVCDIFKCDDIVLELKKSPECPPTQTSVCAGPGWGILF